MWYHCGVKLTAGVMIERRVKVTVDSDVAQDRLEGSMYFLLKDAIEYARLKTFGGYLNEHGTLDLVHLSELEDHEIILKDKLARSALAYFHATTLGKNVPVTLIVQRGE